MVDLSDVEACREGLEALCRAPGSRVNHPLLEKPHKWQPWEVTHSATLDLFNDAAAWEFIADCFHGMVPIKHKKTVEHGDHCYVMIAAQDGATRRIYMKVAIDLRMEKKIPKIGGISFHYERNI